MVDNENWREECRLLQAELETILKERDQWKEKWERLMQFKDAPRLPVRGRSTLDCVGTDNGKIGLRTYTTVGHQVGDDWK